MKTESEITGQKVYTEPPKHEWTCKNCKFWKNTKYNQSGYGSCHNSKILEDETPKDKLNDGLVVLYTYDGSLEIGENFGCIHFETNLEVQTDEQVPTPEYLKKYLANENRN